MGWENLRIAGSDLKVKGELIAERMVLQCS